jgi:Domain of Unknown Function (DUF1080)
MSIRLLNAQGLRGYRREVFPEASWVLESDGVRAIAGAERVDLVTRDCFQDFDFSFEWCLPDAGNSGVLYRVSEELAHSWQSGPEMQLLDDARHPDAAKAETSCGALYALVAPSARPAPKANEFHTGRVVVRGSQVEHWIDEQRVVSCDLASDSVRARISASKFKDFPQFTRTTNGRIALQHHGTDVRFRKLRIAI